MSESENEMTFKTRLKVCLASLVSDKNNDLPRIRSSASSPSVVKGYEDYILSLMYDLHSAQTASCLASNTFCKPWQAEMYENYCNSLFVFVVVTIRIELILIGSDTIFNLKL